jgi:hypothetical protein
MQWHSISTYHYFVYSSLSSGEGQVEAFIGAGTHNSVTSKYSFIGAGESNTNSANHSFIGSGINNVIQAPCSAILGGSGNSDGGFAYAGVYGCNVTAVASKTFHANNFAAQNMPTAAGAVGTFYYVNIGGVCHVAIS